MTAYFDIKEKEIVGCEPETKAYYHEERHAWQLERFPILETFFSTEATIFFFSIIAVFGVAWIAWIPITIIFVLELDAGAYSRWKKWKNQQQ